MQLTSILSDLATPVRGEALVGGEESGTPTADAGAGFSDALSKLAGTVAFGDGAVVETSALQTPQPAVNAQTNGTDGSGTERQPLPIVSGDSILSSDERVAPVADPEVQATVPRQSAPQPSAASGSAFALFAPNVQPQGRSVSDYGLGAQIAKAVDQPPTALRVASVEDPPPNQVQRTAIAPLDASPAAGADVTAEVGRDAKPETSPALPRAVLPQQTDPPLPQAPVVSVGPSAGSSTQDASTSPETRLPPVDPRRAPNGDADMRSADGRAGPGTPRTAANVPSVSNSSDADLRVSRQPDVALRPEATAPAPRLSSVLTGPREASPGVPTTQTVGLTGAAGPDTPLQLQGRSTTPLADGVAIAPRVADVPTEPIEGRPSGLAPASSSPGPVAFTAGPSTIQVSPQPPDRSATLATVPVLPDPDMPAPQSAPLPATAAQAVVLPIVTPVQTALAQQIAQGRALDPGTIPSDSLRADLTVPGEGSPRTVTALPATPLPVTPEAARAVSLQVIEALRQGSGTIDVTLVPEDLGRLRLSIGVSEGAMLVTLSAERPETLDLMRRHIDILQAEARAEGFADLEFAFSGEGSPQDHAQQSPTTVTALPSPETPVSLPAQAPQAGLDLRL